MLQKKEVGLLPHTMDNTKWIKDLNVRAKIIKFIEESIVVNLCNLG